MGRFCTPSHTHPGLFRKVGATFLSPSALCDGFRPWGLLMITKLIVGFEHQLGQLLRFSCKALSLPNGCTPGAKRDRPLFVHSFVVS